MGGCLVVAAATPAGAQLTTTTNAQSAAPSLSGLGGTVSELQGVVGEVESVVCLVLDIAEGQGPPYGPPGAVCAN
jgi:hypothetical protein